MIDAYETSGNSPTYGIGKQAENQLVNALRNDLKTLNASSLAYTLEYAAKAVQRLAQTKTTLDALSTGWWEQEDGPWGSIYAIIPVDASRQIVYVGQTTNLLLRISDHFVTGNAGTCLFINEHTPQLMIVEDGIDKAKLTEREKHWMCDFWNRGYTLVNRQVPPQLRHDRVSCYGKAPAVANLIGLSKVIVKTSNEDVVIPLVDPLFELAPMMLSWLRRDTISRLTPQQLEQAA